MGDKSIKKETKKKKTADIKTPANSVVVKAIVTQPELIKKNKKI